MSLSKLESFFNFFTPNSTKENVTLELKYLIKDPYFFWIIRSSEDGKIYQIRICNEEIYLISDCKEVHVHMSFEEVLSGTNNIMKFTLIDGGSKEIANLRVVNNLEWHLESTDGSLYIIKLRGGDCKVYKREQKVASYTNSSSKGIDGIFKLDSKLEPKFRLLIALSYSIILHLSKCFLLTLHPSTKNSSEAKKVLHFGELMAKSFGNQAYNSYLKGSFVKDGYARDYNFISIFGTIGQYDDMDVGFAV